MGRIIIIFFLIFSYSQVFADTYYAEHEKGWFWFDDPLPKEIHKKESPIRPKTPSEEVNLAKHKLKEALDRAILDPSEQNMEIYITLQNQMSLRANEFANNWQQVLLTHPNLNYSISHPTNNIGLQVFHENESQKKLEVLDNFSKHSGLFFFYRSTCPYCQRFAPILKHFAEAHHIVVIPITTDGVALPEFPDSKPNTGQAQKFNVTVEPSLYAVNPKTEKAFPVAIGLTSETELLNNIYNIMTHYQEGLT